MKLKSSIILYSMLFCYSVLFCSPLASQSEAETTKLHKLSATIKEHLEELKMQSMILTEKLKTSEFKAKQLQIELNELSTNLTNTNYALSDYATQCDNYRMKLEAERSKTIKLKFILSSIICLFVVVRALTIFLKFRGISLPEIVNILL